MPSSPQPRRRARTAGENATAATQPAVHRAHSTPELRSAGRLIQVTTIASKEDAASAPKLRFLPRVSIRLDRRAGGADASASHGGDAARRSVSLVVKRRPRPGKVVTTTVSVDYRVVLFVALVALIASAAGLPVSNGGALGGADRSVSGLQCGVMNAHPCLLQRRCVQCERCYIVFETRTGKRLSSLQLCPTTATPRAHALSI